MLILVAYRLVRTHLVLTPFKLFPPLPSNHIGSMPPFSHTLDDEGACIKSFKLVVNGVFQEKGITEVPAYQK